MWSVLTMRLRGPLFRGHPGPLPAPPTPFPEGGGGVQLATHGQPRFMHDGQNYSSASAYFLATPPHGGGLRPVRGTRQNSAWFLATPPHRGGLRGPWSEPDVSIAGKTSKFRHVICGQRRRTGVVFVVFVVRTGCAHGGEDVKIQTCALLKFLTILESGEE